MFNNYWFNFDQLSKYLFDYLISSFLAYLASLSLTTCEFGIPDVSNPLTKKKIYSLSLNLSQWPFYFNSELIFVSQLAILS